MRCAAIPLVLSLSALPAVAQSPTIRIGVGCAGPTPVILEIEASGAALIHVAVDDLFAWCAAQAPTKSRWRGGA